MLPSSSTPWKPATTAICPVSSVAKIFAPSMVLMRALVNALSVRIFTWWPRKRARLAALGLDGHRGEADGDLLAGRGDDVHLALVGAVGDLVRQLEEAVGLAAHRADDDDDVVALASASRARGARRRGCARRADRGAADFLDDERGAPFLR